jgi:RHH-type proline utilization regulon transcriptional repressor/proline dehydrogenase/delta 1-pyrroline-5-carboxylate dehydrogenase
VEQLLESMRTCLPVETAERLSCCADEFIEAHTRWYASAHDESAVRGEDNWLRYRPLNSLLVLATEEHDAEQLAMIALCARVADCPLEVHVHEAAAEQTLAVASALDAAKCSTEADLLHALEASPAERIRCDKPLPRALLELARQRGMDVVTTPMLRHGRLALLEVLREQSVSVRYHRYGHMGLRRHAL